jgi:hypothetical protein
MIKSFAIMIFLILIGNGTLNAQDTLSINDNQIPIAIADTMNPQKRVDSIQYEFLRAQAMNKAKSSGLDTTVYYKSEDSISFNVKTQIMRLKTEAQIKYKTQVLESDVIELEFKESLLRAKGTIDSTGKLKGYPKFDDAGDTFYGENIKFNFRTSQGVINVGETQINEGFYYGSKIKRISDNQLFVDGGYYTTCDNPEPHFHFASQHMKIITEDRVFLDPLVLYIEDLPVLMIPFGLFFPSKSGRQSGLIVPSFFFSKSRGVVFQNLGFYWAASDYWDTQITTDIYSKGGYMLKNSTRWALRDYFSGNLQVEYGRTRFNVEEEYQTNWKFILNHNHTITPQDNLVVNLDFSSQNFNKNTLINNYDFIKQSITSNASYTRQFDNRASLSLSYGRDQNIITDEYNQNSNLRLNLPSYKIFNSFKSAPRWVQDVQVNYSFNANYSTNKRAVTIIDTTLNDTTDTFIFDHRQRIEHRPGISISPKLGFFTVSPAVSFSMNNYFRKVDKTFNPSDSTVTADTTHGFFTEYTYGFSLSTTTKIYGMMDDQRPFLGLIKPSMIGFKALRHTYNPTFSWRLTPDQSKGDSPFFGKYFDERSQREIIYSRFELDGGGIASRNFSSSINYSDLHSFEIKVKQGDTLPDKNIELLRLNTSTAWNFTDKVLSDIGLQFRSPALNFVEFSGNARFTVYDEEIQLVQDTITGNVSRRYARTKNFLISEGKGLGRLTNLSLSLSTSFSSKGIVVGSGFGSPDNDTTQAREVEFGQRFQQRHDYQYSEPDIFGDRSPGYTPINVPWSMNFRLSYNYSRPSINPDSKTESISLTFGATASLTETWSLNTSGGYDFINKEFNIPQMNLVKDLHCWELIFNWTPIGRNNGFYLKLGIRTPQLKDLKYEMRNNPLLR